MLHETVDALYWHTVPIYSITKKQTNKHPPYDEIQRSSLYFESYISLKKKNVIADSPKKCFAYVNKWTNETDTKRLVFGWSFPF